MAIRRLNNSSVITGSKSSKLWDGETFIENFDSLATYVLSTAQSSVTFNNIPQNYKSLQIRGTVRGTASSNNDWAFFTLNSQSSGTSHYLSGSGTVMDAFAYPNVAQPLTLNMPCATTTANVFGSFIMDVVDYSSLTKNKTTRIFAGFNRNAAGIVKTVSHLYTSTNAVTSITFNSWGLGNFAVGSQFSLYGIRG